MDRIVDTPQEARQGRKTGHVRVILAVSLGLVVVGFLIAGLTVL